MLEEDPIGTAICRPSQSRYPVSPHHSTISIFHHSSNFMDKLVDHLMTCFRSPQYQPLRYLVVGGWNTVFGAIVYAALHYFLNTRVHYLILIIPANVLAITNAFLCYKYLVFHTRGQGWREYFRCYLVYGWIALMNAGILYLLVTFAKLHPSIANGFCIITATFVSYFSHKHFSFATR